MNVFNQFVKTSIILTIVLSTGFSSLGRAMKFDEEDDERRHVPSLQTLPNKLLVKIVTELDDYSLRRLMQTSKKMKLLTMPIVYKNLSDCLLEDFSWERAALDNQWKKGGQKRKSEAVFVWTDLLVPLDRGLPWYKIKDLMKTLGLEKLYSSCYPLHPLNPFEDDDLVAEATQVLPSDDKQYPCLDINQVRIGLQWRERSAPYAIPAANLFKKRMILRYSASLFPLNFATSWGEQRVMTEILQLSTNQIRAVSLCAQNLFASTQLEDRIYIIAVMRMESLTLLNNLEMLDVRRQLAKNVRLNAEFLKKIYSLPSSNNMLESSSQSNEPLKKSPTKLSSFLKDCLKSFGQSKF